MLNLFRSRLTHCSVAGWLLILCLGSVACAQRLSGDEEFGPVVRAYLGYLRDEQEVVDDRASRREVSAAYYRRNSNRIRALRQMSIQIARASQNDYLPELEAVASDELSLLFERPPRLESLRVGEILQTQFRYLGVVRSRQIFYIFARLDPYDQAELMRNINRAGSSAANAAASTPGSGVKTMTRSRRVTSP